MAYNPSTFNYTPMTAGQFQPSQQVLDFSKWLADQGVNMFNLLRADRNTQQAVTNAFQQQQADRENALQQAQLQMAQQQQNVQLPIQQQQAQMAYFNNARAQGQLTPQEQQEIAAMQARIAENAGAFTTNYGGIPGGSYLSSLNVIPGSGWYGTPPQPKSHK